METAELCMIFTILFKTVLKKSTFQKHFGNKLFTFSGNNSFELSVQSLIFLKIQLKMEFQISILKFVLFENTPHVNIAIKIFEQLKSIRSI